MGPVARKLISPLRWRDKYPAWPDYAKELDQLLLFADGQKRLDEFVPKIESRDKQRDEALNELRVAYWFHHMHFPIVQWEPPGLNPRIGEYLINTPEQIRVFVEVKSRGWEGELSDKERSAGRTKQPKYDGLDGGAFGNWQPLQKCIASEKTYPKFSPIQPNLLVVCDDLMVSLHDSIWHVEIGLYANHKGYGDYGYFTSARFENLGAVAVFNAVSAKYERKGGGIDYEFQLFDNPFALPATKLPDSMLRFKTKTRGIVRGTFAHS